MLNKLVSVVIPTYKRNEKLHLSILSVIKQTYSNLEILVINDSFEDELNVQKVLMQFNDERIVYSRNLRRKGGNGARNTGLILAKGKFVTYLDDDDEYMPDRIQNIINFVESNDVTFCFTEYYYMINNKLLTVKTKANPITVERYIEAKFDIGSSSNLFIDVQSISKNDILWDENLIRHQDIEYFIRLIKLCVPGFLSQRLLIVNGHNGFPSAENMEHAKSIFFSTVKLQLEDVKKKTVNKFIALHYRELAVLYGLEQKYDQMQHFLNLSLKARLLNPKSYLRFLLFYLHKRTGIRIRLPRDKMRYINGSE